MTRLQRNLWLLATTAFAVCLTVLALSYIVREPWRILPDIGGDGAKNNLTYLYHSMWGSGYRFQGMNYPYGEHIVFTDGIPLLSVFFASIGNVSAPVALSVLWSLLGISYVLSVVYLCKILLRFGTTPLYAMVFAGFITILTPQMICLRGHYALSFTCIIPMLFYWSLCYHDRPLLRYCGYIFIMGLLASLLHPYYAGLILVWAGAYGLWYLFLTAAPLAKKIRHIAPMVVAGLSVPAIVMVLIKLTDKVTDRPQTPYNPSDSYTNLPQIITSYYSPFWKALVDRSILPKVSNGGEGYSYPGLVVLAILSLLLLQFIYRRFRRAATPFLPLPAFGNVWIYMAFSVLIFSMGIPFIWHMQWLIEYLFVFKQFRALGRFVWISYYIATVYAAVVMYYWYTALLAAGKKKIAWSLLSLATLIWALEVRGYIKTTREISEKGAYNYDMIYSNYEQKWTEFLAANKMNATDFQAILLLKFFHVGTEKIWVGDPGWMMTLGSKAALQLQLPIIDVMMSRSSWSQAQSQVKLVAGPYAYKPLLDTIHDNRPFLTLVFKTDVLAPGEEYLLASSDYLGEHNDCRVYACYPDRIRSADKKHTDSAMAIAQHMQAADTAVGAAGTWFAAHYDQGTAKEILFGNGALPAIRQQDSTIAVIPVSITGDSLLYEFSCWFLLSAADYRSPDVMLHLLDANGNVISTIKAATNTSIDSRDAWFRCAQYFYIPAACRSIRCQLINIPAPAYRAMDELLLYPAAATVISKAGNGSIMVNGHFLKNN